MGAVRSAGRHPTERQICRSPRIYRLLSMAQVSLECPLLSGPIGSCVWSHGILGFAKIAKCDAGSLTISLAILRRAYRGGNSRKILPSLRQNGTWQFERAHLHRSMFQYLIVRFGRRPTRAFSTGVA